MDNSVLPADFAQEHLGGGEPEAQGVVQCAQRKTVGDLIGAQLVVSAYVGDLQPHRGTTQLAVEAAHGVGVGLQHLLGETCPAQSPIHHPDRLRAV